MEPSLKVIKRFSCSTQLTMIFILLVNVKMPTSVGIPNFITMYQDKRVILMQKKLLFFGIIIF